jgi:predicted lactoylglutathione lyase
MHRLIFVNLPVTDLAAATAFYTGLGFGLNPEFSSDGCSCIVVSETIFVMLLTRDRFADFTAGPVGDPRVPARR